MSKTIDVTIIGGGMITNDLILPSVYHLQRVGVVGKINVCALNSAPLKMLEDNHEIREAFPGQEFTAYPSVGEPSGKVFPDLYKDVISEINPRQAVVIAVPDQFHHQMVLDSLELKQHVLCVKPLVMKYSHSVEIEKMAYEKGLFVGIEYHKRFDRRSLIAKRDYAQGRFGEFIMGEAKMIEPYFYRFSNFQNWFTTEATDPFVYVGCHYVDLVYFITGLKPVGVSVSGVKGKFPNGNECFLWANGRVIFENEAILSLIVGLGYPDEGAGSNEQCLTLFFEGDGKCGLLKHNDQFRGVSHCYGDDQSQTQKRFQFVNPDFFRMIPWDGPGYRPIGYGFDSIANNIHGMHRIENEVELLDEKDALLRRREILKETDAQGLIATPGNSYINELVHEAARISILNRGRMVKIVYSGIPYVEKER